MNKVIEIFKEIQSTSGLNDKKKIITDNKDNELFKKCLKFLLDGNVVTGISDKKLSKGVNLAEGLREFSLETIANLTFEDIIEYLLTHNSGKDSDIAFVKIFIKHQPEQYQEFYFQMITKKFRLGADAKLVNKCIPGLIPTWDIQQAYPLTDKNEPKDDEWFALSQKLNGNNNGILNGKCVSRQGKEFTGMSHIIEDIDKLPFKDMFFNGELVRKNIDNVSDEMNFQIGTGIINSDDADKSCIKFVIYEMLPKEDFLNGESKLTYKQRRKEYLEPLAEEIAKLGLENIEVVPLVYEGNDKTKIQELLDKYDKLGWEGLMLNKDSKWKNKRNNGILKVKSFKHADLLCTDIVEGEGKYKGMLGNIICDYKGYNLGVGSGFTDEQRDYYWNNRNEIIGRVVTVKYKSETKNKDGGISVQFPTFVIVREKGKTVSYNG